MKVSQIPEPIVAHIKQTTAPSAMNSEQLSILECLANTFVLNNQAAQNMILGRYDDASHTLVQALESVYELLARTSVLPMCLNASVSIDIAWETSAYQPNSNFTILSSSIFTKPLVLQAGPSKEGCNFLPPIAFAVVVNLGICRHIQALQQQDYMSVPSKHDLPTFEKAIELYLQAGNIARMFQQGGTTSHFELILLNNLGHAYEQLNCDLQTRICFQSLSIAAAEFRRVDDSYACNHNIQALVDNFLRWEQRIQVADFTFAAPVA